MIAPSRIPAEYNAWNKQHGAPAGRNVAPTLKSFSDPNSWDKMQGYFRASSTARTRTFEYPWVYFAVSLPRSSQVLHIGSKDGGFQRFLKSFGHSVAAIDTSPDAHASTNLHLSEDRVDLPLSRFHEVPAGTIDYIYAISSLEQLSFEQAASIIKESQRCLKPGGTLAITLSLFLNLKPFTTRDYNSYGSNHNVMKLVSDSRMIITQGKTNELYGYNEFSSDIIQSSLERYLVGDYPVLKQCFSLIKA